MDRVKGLHGDQDIKVEHFGQFMEYMGGEYCGHYQDRNFSDMFEMRVQNLNDLTGELSKHLKVVSSVEAENEEMRKTIEKKITETDRKDALIKEKIEKI